MQDYIRMLVEEEFDMDVFASALREKIRDELDYDHFANIILERFDIEEMAEELIDDNLSLPF